MNKNFHNRNFEAGCCEGGPPSQDLKSDLVDDVDRFIHEMDRDAAIRRIAHEVRSLSRRVSSLENPPGIVMDVKE